VGIDKELGEEGGSTKKRSRKNRKVKEKGKFGKILTVQ